MSRYADRIKKIEEIVRVRQKCIRDTWTQEELAEWAIVTRTNDIRGLLYEMDDEVLNEEYERVYGITPQEDKEKAND